MRKYTVSFVVEVSDREFLKEAFTYGYRTRENYIKSTLVSQAKAADSGTISITEIPNPGILPLHEKSLG